MKFSFFIGLHPTELHHRQTSPFAHRDFWLGWNMNPRFFSYTGLAKSTQSNFSLLKIIFQMIRKAVRELFGVERPRLDRSISLPPWYPWTHYLKYRVPTGPTRGSMTPFELFKNMGILDKGEPCPFGHWDMIESTWPPFPCNRFGLAPRKNVYRRDEPIRNLENVHIWKNPRRRQTTLFALTLNKKLNKVEIKHFYFYKIFDTF